MPLLAGTECTVFLEGRPDRPGRSPGMTITITPAALADGVDLTASITGFLPGEGLRRFNYNIFGRGRMVEYSGEFRRADARGRFTWIVSPSTGIYREAWGRPALCVVGQRSQRLACAWFAVATEPAAARPAPAAPAKPARAATTTSPSRTAPAEKGKDGKCIDAGFSIICSD